MVFVCGIFAASHGGIIINIIITATLRPDERYLEVCLTPGHSGGGGQEGGEGVGQAGHRGVGVAGRVHLHL